MQKVQDRALDIFFLLGQRMAFLLLIILAITFVVTEHATPAFSADLQPQKFVPQQQSDVPYNSIPPQLSLVTISAHITSVVVPSPTPTPIVDTSSDDIWNKLAECESHQNWSDDTGNGYYGGLQFSQGAWESVGGSGNPAHASSDEQISRAKLLQTQRGWGAWGACAKKLGLN